MSSNLKNLSNENSFVSDHSDEGFPNFIKKSKNNQGDDNNYEILSPFM